METILKMWLIINPVMTPFNMSAFRGQNFVVPLMVVDESCIPSVDVIQAFLTKESNGTADLQDGHIHLASKLCSNYNYKVSAERTEKVTIQLFQHKALQAS